MDVKKEYKLCQEIYKTINNLNLIFIKKTNFDLSLCSRVVRKQYKLNLDIPRKKQVVFGTASLGYLGLRTWNNILYHIKYVENMNVFKYLVKKANGSSRSCNVYAL